MPPERYHPVGVLVVVQRRDGERWSTVATVATAASMVLAERIAVALNAAGSWSNEAIVARGLELRKAGG